MKSRPGPSTAPFLPLPPRNLATPPPIYHRPVLIATYSHLPDRSIVHNDASMAYYRPAPLGADLNHGFERRIERDEETEEHLDGLCESLMRLIQKGKGAERRGGIITWRGMITRMMTAPFEDREGWEMSALALDGSVYVELYDPPEVRAKRRKDSSTWAWQSYMGYSYESYSTIPAGGEDRRPDDPEGWSGDVNTNVQWCNVIRSAIGEIPLCLGGEVDCVRAGVGGEHPGLEACVELKTNKVVENEKQEAVFHKKLLKHWAQSWLLGIPTVEVGFRDDAGILKTQRVFETRLIPRLQVIPLHVGASLIDLSVGAASRPAWRPGPSNHFLHALLSFLTAHVLPTDSKPSSRLPADHPLPPATLWRLRFTPKQGCELYYAGEAGLKGGRWGGMLTEEYVRWRMR